MITINIDGAARGNPGPAGYGIIARDKSGAVLREAYGYIGEQTNNFAEYTALLAALELALREKWKEVRIKSDSQLLVKQIRGEYKVKNSTLFSFHRRATALLGRFDSFSVVHVERGNNKEADKLANKAVDTMSSDPREINPIRVRQK